MTSYLIYLPFYRRAPSPRYVCSSTRGDTAIRGVEQDTKKMRTHKLNMVIETTEIPTTMIMDVQLPTHLELKDGSSVLMAMQMLSVDRSPQCKDGLVKLHLWVAKLAEFMVRLRWRLEKSLFVGEPTFIKDKGLGTLEAICENGWVVSKDGQRWFVEDEDMLGCP